MHLIHTVAQGYRYHYCPHFTDVQSINNFPKVSRINPDSITLKPMVLTIKNRLERAEKSEFA